VVEHSTQNPNIRELNPITDNRKEKKKKQNFTTIWPTLCRPKFGRAMGYEEGFRLPRASKFKYSEKTVNLA
jgi:hypothetical protein